MLSGRYEIEKTLSEGENSKVYKAFDTKLKKTVAIKEINKEKISREFKVRFQREIEILSKLDHPNIIPIYDFQVSDSEIYYVMKYVDGPDLKKFVVNLTDQAKIPIFLTLLNAVSYIHKKKIIHRDLKPANILFDTYGIMYIIDFGISKIDDDIYTKITKTKSFIGTVNYSSPEQIKGEKPKATSDIYSLGIIFYEILTGKVPFEGQLQAVFHAHLYLPPPPLSEDSKFKIFEQTIFRMLEKDPIVRIDDCSAIIRDIENKLYMQKEKEEKPKILNFFSKKRLIYLLPALFSLALLFSVYQFRSQLLAVLEQVKNLKKPTDNSPAPEKNDKQNDPQKPTESLPIPEKKAEDSPSPKKTEKESPAPDKNDNQKETEMKIEKNSNQKKEEPVLEEKETKKIKTEKLFTVRNVALRKDPTTASSALNIIPAGTKLSFEKMTVEQLGTDGKMYHWYKETKSSGYVLGQYLRSKQSKTITALKKTGTKTYLLRYQKEVSQVFPGDFILKNGKLELVSEDETVNGKYEVLQNRIILKYGNKRLNLCYEADSNSPSEKNTFTVCE